LRLHGRRPASIAGSRAGEAKELVRGIGAFAPVVPTTVHREIEAKFIEEIARWMKDIGCAAQCVGGGVIEAIASDEQGKNQEAGNRQRNGFHRSYPPCRLGADEAERLRTHRRGIASS